MKSEHILQNWLAAVSALQLHYNQIVHCIETHKVWEKRSKKPATYIGQCPTAQLLTLLAKMQEELERLLLDIENEEPIDPSDSDENYQKLVAHSQVLDDLNQQAKAMLHLTALPAS